MSKAAASLALASGNLATENTYERRRAAVDPYVHSDLYPDSGSWNPIWQQSSYALSSNDVVPGNVQPNLADRNSGTESGTSAHVQFDHAPSLNHGSSLDSADGKKDITNRPAYATPVFESTATVSLSDTISSQAKDTPTAQAQINAGNTSTAAPLVTAGLATDENKSTAYQDTNEPGPTRAEPASFFDTTLESKSHFKLTRASDELPAVAFLCQQYPKTICFYRYWDAAQSLVDTASADAHELGFVASPSLKAKHISAAIASFLEQPKSVILWSSNAAFPGLLDLALRPDIQVIHIGHLSTLNDLTNGKLLLAMPAKRRNKIHKEYPINASNDRLNEYGDTSVLHPHRLTLRASLAEESLAPSLYKAFISYHRVCNLAWTTYELAERANEFARDYLLRGDSKAPVEMVGGRIRLKQAEVAKWDLGLAVQSGAILVGY
ncbi:hypothetical protein FRC10_005579 [Ceratobasidium sp. 414]|nr:hypothetical protein FRC10_005579 [Ceratobasidium sp. 414]